MMFMNEYEIDAAEIRYRGAPILGEASQALRRFKDAVNENSDGWPYWSAAPRAAKSLMLLVQRPETATTESLKKALTPIKAFCTRKGLNYDPR